MHIPQTGTQSSDSLPSAGLQASSEDATPPFGSLAQVLIPPTWARILLCTMPGPSVTRVLSFPRGGEPLVFKSVRQYSRNKPSAHRSMHPFVCNNCNCITFGAQADLLHPASYVSYRCAKRHLSYTRSVVVHTIKICSATTWQDNS